MTRTLFVYWQQLTQRSEDEGGRAEAPVLDLDACFGAACFGPPVIAARQTVHLAPLAVLAGGAEPG